MKSIFTLILKGIAIGAANVIPGVSGGTIALITGVFERLINAIKSFNLTAAKLLFTGKWRAFADHTDLLFLVQLFFGIGFSILSIARLFDYLFIYYPVYIWSYFFGLILASIYFVGKIIDHWSTVTVIMLIAGLTVAVTISIMTPASESNNTLYLLLCGVVGACSMILPGLSGSFVLILLGNYQLVMIDAVNNLDFGVLLPVIIGAVAGLLGFSYLLSWVFKKYRNQTLALLTGFIAGSLGVLWPWKETYFKTDALGALLLKNDGSKIVEGYHWLFPQSLNGEVLAAMLLMILGVLTIALLEIFAKKQQS